MNASARVSVSMTHEDANLLGLSPSPFVRWQESGLGNLVIVHVEEETALAVAHSAFDAVASGEITDEVDVDRAESVGSRLQSAVFRARRARGAA